ncbi:unnamed protein product [Didymodactylos carnosus]|uniref:Uncharacterized protein n=1 Tax=Didymodactylos carnosus TaxID=1234261 RepID=A0A815CCM9_9BILA|nr:unnamed protein product [Didymodactylos carnosus]CAF1285436.1 unnamed protein product [Didymodactylos carnosus]CAF3847113.1 unnamed protein product [Didymodactylos carnosus]CAF4085178.1 unnamed protein product [Didymodactylos carnosus]
MPMSSANLIKTFWNSYISKGRQATGFREDEITVCEYLGEWSKKNVPVNLVEFVRFIDRSILLQKQVDPTSHGLVVHDRVGGSKAAFYCIAKNLIDRLLIDRRVSVENFAADICQQRMNAIEYMEQYLALYDAVCIWNELFKRQALLNESVSQYS